MAESPDGRSAPEAETRDGGPATATAEAPKSVDELTADALVEAFAQEVAVALGRVAESAAHERTVGSTFRDLWQDYRLNDDLGPASTDTQQVLQKAFKLATTYPQKPLTVDVAASAVGEERNTPEDGLKEKFAQLRQRLNNAYGGEIEAQDPERWLGESLARLAAAVAVRDVVKMDDVALIASGDQTRSIAEAAPEVLKAAAQSQAATAEAWTGSANYRTAAERTSKLMLATTGSLGTAVGVVSHLPPGATKALVEVATGVVIVGVGAITTRRSLANQRHAGGELGGLREKSMAARENLIAAVDRLPPTSRGTQGNTGGPAR